MRTTIDLDPSVLAALKQRRDAEGKTLGQVASELLATALAERPAPRRPLEWHSQSMGMLIDIDDKDALAAALDADYAG